MDDPLGDLKRRAYARPTSESDAAEAQALLARLATGEVVIPVEPEAPRPGAVRLQTVTIASPRAHVAIAVIALLCVAGAVTAPLPHNSLSVFDRPQDPVDLAAPAWAFRSGMESPFGAQEPSIRWLTDYHDAQVYAYLTPDGWVCLTLIQGAGAGVSCASPGEFAEGGVILGYGTTGGDGPWISVVWGPEGGPRFYEGTAPAAENP